MEGLITQSLAVDAFQLSLAEIDDIDIDQLHALSVAVGWPHRAEDWAFLRQVGRGIVALDDIGRVLGSAMWFHHGETFATVGMVITSPRLQALGTGQWLMKQVMASCCGRDLRLNATHAARRLYQMLDFVPEHTIFLCQGEAHAVGDVPGVGDGSNIRSLDQTDIAAVAELDARAFGVSRSRLIGRLFEESTGHGLFRDGQLEAFALCRRFGRGYVVGPVVAATDAAAIAVVRPHVAEHAGQFMRVDTRCAVGDFPAFLARSGMPVFDTVLTMSYAGPGTVRVAPNTGKAATYALASHALA